jgi:thiol:disulfide interchange protein DsbA
MFTPSQRSRLSCSFAALGLLMLSPCIRADDKWIPGVDYSILAPAQETDVPKGKIEVLELFMYTSPLSRDIQPHLAKWMVTKAPYIEYRREPSIGFPHAAYQARTYYTFKKLGRGELHEKFWVWVFDKTHYPIYHTIRHPDVAGYERLNVDFAVANGIEREKFLSVYNSKEMDEAVIDAAIGIHNYHLVGTSTLVINGKYCVSVQRFVTKDPIRKTKPEDFEKLLRLVDDLAQREHTSTVSSP